MDELRSLAHELERFYEVDKVKCWGVFIWEEDENIFDIFSDGISWYVKERPLKEGSEEIINQIIDVLKGTEK